jgi:hypothetical protein
MSVLEGVEAGVERSFGTVTAFKTTSRSTGSEKEPYEQLGCEAVVRLLVERDDVEADSKDENGRTPLWWAAERGHEAVVRLLVERDDVEADLKDENGCS